MPPIPTLDSMENVVLSNFMRGNVPANYINREVCPPIPVYQDTGSYLVTENGRLIYDDERAQNTRAKSVDFNFSTETYAIIERALSGTLDKSTIDKARELGGGPEVLTLQQDMVKFVDDLLEAKREKRVADIVFGTSYYDSTMKTELTTTSCWSDSVNSDPVGNISSGQEAVRGKTGMHPNALVLGATAFATLRKHPKVITLFGDINHRGQLTIEELKELFEVQKVIVGRGTYNAGTVESPTVTDFWADSCAIINIPSLPELKAGYPCHTVMFENLAKSKVYEHDEGEVIRYILKRFYAPKHISLFNGYLYTNVVA